MMASSACGGIKQTEDTIEHPFGPDTISWDYYTDYVVFHNPEKKVTYDEVCMTFQTWDEGVYKGMPHSVQVIYRATSGNTYFNDNPTINVGVPGYKWADPQGCD